MAMTEILTPDEASAALKVPRKTVVLLCLRGELVGARKVGRLWRIPRSALEALFSEDHADLQKGPERVARRRVPSRQAEGLGGDGEPPRRRGLRGVKANRGSARAARRANVLGILDENVPE